MKSNVFFVTTPTADTRGTALVLHFDNKRYMVGQCHEGFQRACIQRNVGLKKVQHMFLTGRTEWASTGGVIGTILTVADAVKEANTAIAEKNAREEERQRAHGKGKPPIPRQKLTIHGGRNITHTLATARRFVFRKGMPVDVNEFDGLKEAMPEPTWWDENVRIWAIGVEPTERPEPNIPLSPGRKRSFDDYMETSKESEGTDAISQVEDGLSTDKREQMIRRSVVNDMFDSDWRLDALFETSLREVKLPCKLFVRNKETKKLEEYSGPLPGQGQNVPDITVLVRKPWPGSLVTNLPPTKQSRTSMSYIIRNHPQRGRFLPQKATELGVPPGPAFAQLTKGHAWKGPDGKTVRPEDVLAPGKPGGGIAVVDVPSPDYVENLTRKGEWDSPEIMEGVEAMVWILGPGVLHDRKLQEFMLSNSHLRQVISSPDCCPNYLANDAVAAATVRLAQVDSDRFPVPVHSNTCPSIPESIGFAVPAERGLIIQLEPKVELQTKEVPKPLNTALVVRTMDRAVKMLAEAANGKLEELRAQRKLAGQSLPSPEAEIVTLGTGSAMPSKYRNVSATLVRVPGAGSYLLDCGENTLGQLSRVYPPDELDEVLKDLKLVWISHLHADHHLGTTSIIKAWYRAVYGAEGSTPRTGERTAYRNLTEGKRLTIASDGAMLRWLREYSSVEDFGFDMLIPLQVWSATTGKPGTTILECNGQRVGFNEQRSRLATEMKAATGLVDLQACNVPHCYGAKGVSLTFPDGFKLTYSGDCRPSYALVEIGQGSTVLLHEATFDDELRADALAKGHSTTSEAIGVGIAMGAKRILLTHFSQRYQKIPVMDAIDLRDLQLEVSAQNGTDESMASAADGAEDLPVEPTEKPFATKVSQPRAAEPRRSIGEMVEDDVEIDDILNSKFIPEKAARAGGPRIMKVASYRRKPPADLKIGVAFDYMKVKVKDIEILEEFTPALLKLYQQEIDGRELLSVKRNGKEAEEDRAEDMGQRGKRNMNQSLKLVQ